MPSSHISLHLRHTDQFTIRSAFPESEHALDAMFLTVTSAKDEPSAHIHFDSVNQIRKLRDALSMALLKIEQDEHEAERVYLMDRNAAANADAENWE